MTGYGEATRETERFVLSVEVRSVNNRFLKLIAKVPEEVSFLQYPMEDHIRSCVVRGSIHLTLRFDPVESADMYEVDESILKKYVASVAKLKKELKRQDEVRLSDFLLLPGVVRTEEAFVPEKEEILPVMTEVLDEALQQLLSMRELEGRHLEEDLRERTRRLNELLECIRREAPRAVEEYHRKLDQRVRLLLGDQQAALAPEDLLKEAAILAERSDISEEIARLESHIRQFSESLDSDQPVGRKLEFIVQEMFRESNTMGSKSASSELSRHIVDFKAEVDRLKEQVVNIE